MHAPRDDDPGAALGSSPPAVRTAHQSTGTKDDAFCTANCEEAENSANGAIVSSVGPLRKHLRRCADVASRVASAFVPALSASGSAAPIVRKGSLLPGVHNTDKWFFFHVLGEDDDTCRSWALALAQQHGVLCPARFSVATVFPAFGVVFASGRGGASFRVSPAKTWREAAGRNTSRNQRRNVPTDLGEGLEDTGSSGEENNDEGKARAFADSASGRFEQASCTFTRVPNNAPTAVEIAPAGDAGVNHRIHEYGNRQCVLITHQFCATMAPCAYAHRRHVDMYVSYELEPMSGARRSDSPSWLVHIFNTGTSLRAPVLDVDDVPSATAFVRRLQSCISVEWPHEVTAQSPSSNPEAHVELTTTEEVARERAVGIRGHGLIGNVNRRRTSTTQQNFVSQHYSLIGPHWRPEGTRRAVDWLWTVNQLPTHGGARAVGRSAPQFLSLARWRENLSEQEILEIDPHEALNLSLSTPERPALLYTGDGGEGSDSAVHFELRAEMGSAYEEARGRSRTGSIFHIEAVSESSMFSIRSLCELWTRFTD